MMINYDEILANIDNIPEELPSPVYELDISTGNMTEKADPFNTDIARNKLGIDEVYHLIYLAKKVIVDTNENAEIAVNIALEARALSLEITKRRKEITEPYLRFQKKAIDIEKEYTDRLKEVEVSLLQMVTVYKEKQKKALEQHNIIDTSLEHISTEVGSGSTRNFFEYKVVDIDKIPREYLKIDKVKVDAAVKAGVRHIDGIEIYETSKVQYRLKPKSKIKEIETKELN